MSAVLSAGFADPVRDAQRCFRAVLDAMSRPGQVRAVPSPDVPPPLAPAAAAVLLALVDHETPLWLDPALEAGRTWIDFHAGAPMVAEPDRAAFVMTATLPALDRLNAGTHETPETSATVILQVASLEHGTPWRLSGPGLRIPATLSVAGLPDGFAAAWRTNRGLYPCGIDLILCCGDRLAALPRTVSIEEA